MIQILSVDDNQARTDQVREILHTLNISEANVVYVDTLIDAKRQLTQKKPDLLILDLALPYRKDSQPTPDAGSELLQEIITIPSYKMPNWVFIISEYEKAIQTVENITKQLPCTVIKYDSSSDEWKDRLQSYIEQILRADAGSKTDYSYDAAILCALDDPELSEIRRLPFEWEAKNILGDPTDYYTGSFMGKKILCAAAHEMGLSSAAILATKMAISFRPKYLIMTGIAGGANPDSSGYGDVIVADPCFDYECGKRTISDGKSVFMPDYRQVRLDNTVLAAVRRIIGSKATLQEIKDNCTYPKPETVLQLHVGPVGSGASVLSDEVIIASVKEHNRKLLGFDMEAYAVMLAGALSAAPRTTPIVMKGISDFGTGKNDQYQKYASYTSAHVMQKLLEELFK